MKKRFYFVVLTVLVIFFPLTSMAVANPVSSNIEKKYQELGGRHSFLGKPLSEERWCSDHKGRHRAFQYGHIFWYPNPNIGTHEVHGAILNKYKALGWERGPLGYPMTDEKKTMDNVRYNLFQNGLILWTRERGALVATYDGNIIDSLIDFDKLDQTPYGNLKDFYMRIKKWYKIDLRRNLDLNTGIPKYKGWQVADFWNGNYKLNGYYLSPKERLIISSAQVLLLQWHLHDLRNHDKLRIAIIDKYFDKSSCFKRNWSLRHRRWNYNNWCSEFASYLYRRAGAPVSLKKKQCFWCKNKGEYKKIGWTISNVAYFVRYFKKHNQYHNIEYFRNNKSPYHFHVNRSTLKIGDYLTTYKNGKACSSHLNGHSMIVLGYDEEKKEEKSIVPIIIKKIFIINGNAASKQWEGKNASPQSKNKLVVYESRDLNDSDLSGVGIRWDIFK